MPLKHWLSSLFHSILKVFGMSDTPWSYVEYPLTPMEVEVYEKHLANTYSAVDDAYRHMNDLLVPLIMQYKIHEGL
jgi:hypothetical protein